MYTWPLVLTCSDPLSIDVHVFDSCRLTKLVVSCCSRGVRGASGAFESIPSTPGVDAGCGRPSVQLLRTCRW